MQPAVVVSCDSPPCTRPPPHADSFSHLDCHIRQWWQLYGELKCQRGRTRQLSHGELLKPSMQQRQPQQQQQQALLLPEGVKPGTAPWIMSTSCLACLSIICKVHGPCCAAHGPGLLLTHVCRCHANIIQPPRPPCALDLLPCRWWVLATPTAATPWWSTATCPRCPGSSAPSSAPTRHLPRHLPPAPTPAPSRPPRAQVRQKGGGRCDGRRHSPRGQGWVRCWLPQGRGPGLVRASCTVPHVDGMCVMARVPAQEGLQTVLCLARLCLPFTALTTPATPRPSHPAVPRPLRTVQCCCFCQRLGQRHALQEQPRGQHRHRQGPAGQPLGL